jgi:hypothetical protein
MPRKWTYSDEKLSSQNVYFQDSNSTELIMAASSNPIVLRGILQDSGVISLNEAPNLPAGPVEVTLQVLPRQSHRRTEAPLEDTSVAPPFELPRMGPFREVLPRRVTRRLPDGLLDDES